MATEFDRVVIDDDDQAEYTLGEFLQLPLHHRIELILARKLLFFAGRTKVDQPTALRILRQRSVGRSEPR